MKLQFQEHDPATMRRRAQDFYDLMQSRRSVRQFSDRAIPPGVIEHCLLTAGSAPSGANRQPWHFAVVSNPEIKREIRTAAETEERAFYDRRAPRAWLDDLEPLGTDADKPFLEIAPLLIVVFSQKYGIDPDGSKHKNYYVPESVGIATGLLIAALHNAGLATLTHTPSPMKFLNRVLERPANERATMVLVTGYPAADAEVPDINRKPLEDIASFIA